MALTFRSMCKYPQLTDEAAYTMHNQYFIFSNPFECRLLCYFDSKLSFSLLSPGEAPRRSLKISCLWIKNHLYLQLKHTNKLNNKKKKSNCFSFSYRITNFFRSNIFSFVHHGRHQGLFTTVF